MTRIENVGEITSSNGDVLLRMWHAIVEPRKRSLFHHSHARFEITLVASGSGVYFTPSGNHEIHEGDMLIFSGNEPHCITEIHSKGLELINLHFEPRYLFGDSHNSLSVKHADFCFVHAANFKNHIPANATLNLAELFLRMEDELKRKDDEYVLCVKSLLNLLLISLIRDYGYCTKVSTHRMNEILSALEYIDMHLSESLTLEAIAHVAGMSPNYFSALFKRFCNVTLWEYISSKRIEKASHMMLDQNFKGTMLDIALACGYNNTANFNKAFRKHIGMTPSAYRKSEDILLH